MRKQTNRSALPDGWQRDLDEKADLEGSFSALAGCRHFYADALRGRIRSLQLRPKAAKSYFVRAIARADREPHSLAAMIRQFLTNAFRLENALMERPPKLTMEEEPMPSLPELTDEMLAEYPEMRIVQDARKLVEALLRLHARDSYGAAVLFEDVLLEDPPCLPETRIRSLIGHAAVIAVNGVTDEALGRLEAAGLELHLTASTLTRAWQGSVLAAAYEYLALTDDALAWRQFVDALPCPVATKAVFRRRGERMLRRSRKAGMMMVL